MICEILGCQSIVWRVIGGGAVFLIVVSAIFLGLLLREAELETESRRKRRRVLEKEIDEKLEKLLQEKRPDKGAENCK